MVSLGEWTGPVDFFVVTMDNYPIVLGMEFLDKVKAVLVQFANTMCILEEGNMCMVPLELEAKIKAKSISAMQLAKIMKKAQPTYVAAIKEEEDPLSADLAAITSPSFPLVDQIKEGLKHDPQAKSLMELPSQGKTRRFWLEDGVLVTKGSRMYIPKWQGLRREIIKECHDSRWAGHPEVSQTERVNELLELYLRHYVSANQKGWAKLLDIAQFSYNLEKSKSTGASPFEIATGQQPMTPHTLAVG
ncbi:Retrovirus-related Pol polyprotein from transposon 17.6 [Senna tora]|uniref:Retrovirus-related Pol polyprotein from transposon 17.6 n=1 Tax=Senna tora TaxID=362788 RepID=A0A834WJE7_9FABA|nr:Retrovirus-related Pol polyprotein from transposon 17.6 [Senna tora]